MKILVIDPSPHFLRAMCNFINAMPRCECIAATSLDEAFEQPAVQEVNLALINYSLRNADAKSAAHRINFQVPAAMVLLLTADAADYCNSSLAAEAHGCLAINSLRSDLPQLVAGLAHELERERA
jgi:DNA-binding NarL/FixJ family response regulator